MGRIIHGVIKKMSNCLYKDDGCMRGYQRGQKSFVTRREKCVRRVHEKMIFAMSKRRTIVCMIKGVCEIFGINYQLL